MAALSDNVTMTETPEQRRIALLKSFLEKDPSDDFSRYALALEYVKLNQLDKAAQEFEHLILHAPDYTATYYHLGKVYEKQCKLTDAKEIYQKGIVKTAQRGEAHAHKELREALTMLAGGDDDDE
jgi:Tfp pilus assembly protein PilF